MPTKKKATAPVPAVASPDPPSYVWWQDQSLIKQQRQYSHDEFLAKNIDSFHKVDMTSHYLHLAFRDSYGDIRSFTADLVDVLRDNNRDEIADKFDLIDDDDFVMVDKDAAGTRLDKIEDLLNTLLEDVTASQEQANACIANDTTDDAVGLLEQLLFIIDRDVVPDVKRAHEKVTEHLKALTGVFEIGE